METSVVERAIRAGVSVAVAHGLRVDDASVVHNSNRIAVHLSPCETLARVAPLAYQSTDDDLEVVVAGRLVPTGSPVAGPDPRVEPRVHARDGFAVTLWAYHEPVAPSAIGPAEYAEALVRLHDGLRRVEVSAPHFTDRVVEAQQLLADKARTADLLGADRALLGDTLSRLSAEITGRGGDEQLLHGEPHLGNVLRTRDGLLFVDFETCCRGPVEFDLAHGLLPSEDDRKLPADEVCGHYPGVDAGVVDQCRVLIWAMITTWRWRHDDQLPNGRFWRDEGLDRLRAALARARTDGAGGRGPQSPTASA
jgi:hypothetical protein